MKRYQLDQMENWLEPLAWVMLTICARYLADQI
jgi:hypothetical protein